MDEWNSNFSFCELPRNWENLAMCTKNLQKLCPTDLCSIKSGSIRFHFKNFSQTQSAPGWLVLPKIARKHPKIKKIIQGLGSEGWGRQGGRVPRQIPLTPTFSWVLNFAKTTVIFGKTSFTRSQRKTALCQMLNISSLPNDHMKKSCTSRRKLSKK